MTKENDEIAKQISKGIVNLIFYPALILIAFYFVLNYLTIVLLLKWFPSFKFLTSAYLIYIVCLLVKIKYGK